ncbi:hypothetical protein PE143B_0127930 [Pseudomonas extremaustralis 14-3 substr. 14-3b]|nr:hypothetical protein PE143B_0127930 [Pseudomonas extremaustralis 14-3 substr. 14-3b]
MPVALVLNEPPKSQHWLSVTFRLASCVNAGGVDQIDISVGRRMWHQAQQLSKNNLVALAAFIACLHQRRTHIRDRVFELVQLSPGIVAFIFCCRTPRHDITLDRAIPVNDAALFITLGDGKKAGHWRGFTGQRGDKLQSSLVDGLPRFAHGDELVTFACTKQRTVHAEHSLVIQSVGSFRTVSRRSP